VLLAIGAATRDDIEVLLRRRAAGLGEPAADEPEPGRAALHGHLDSRRPQLTPDRRHALLDRLGDLGALPAAELEHLRGAAGPWPDNEHIGIERVGATLSVAPGSPIARAGVCVLATELCERGVLVHLHYQPRAAGGDARPWLSLHDDLGTRYRGEAPPAPPLGPLEDDPPGLCVAAFVPAMPSASTRLWLARLDLR